MHGGSRGRGFACRDAQRVLTPHSGTLHRVFLRGEPQLTRKCLKTAIEEPVELREDVTPSPFAALRPQRKREIRGTEGEFCPLVWIRLLRVVLVETARVPVSGP
ncbi:hypothetical protein AV530_009216 [Patagioenas fasciata monilis]|uniref:Uncharacterized protein n=1 Tax=Patagioenas fasciata monilis TaxID=372326 RepID=A0A1V4KPD9_PATFA|nr:hypothetical protein AV530_009216 [Patagioenas fasciata monilis]